MNDSLNITNVGEGDNQMFEISQINRPRSQDRDPLNLNQINSEDNQTNAGNAPEVNNDDLAFKGLHDKTISNDPTPIRTEVMSENMKVMDNNKFSESNSSKLPEPELVTSDTMKQNLANFKEYMVKKTEDENNAKAEIAAIITNGEAYYEELVIRGENAREVLKATEAEKVAVLHEINTLKNGNIADFRARERLYRKAA